ncbi:MAG: YihA family ribosome biogenesis GTP-binding protein [Spirochaetes bacterium]|nr:YihA family ribosome biogenesis GTP-binding protein [Spirochaetota bacterium]
MKINNVKFVKSAAKVADFPRFSFPEFAFFGRSNVGKSSLINMITGRRNLVKVGSRPGVTKLVNFFLINESICLADMPGFGYAELPKNVKGKFLPLIKDYINNRSNLRLTFLLVDIRRTPGDLERDIVTLLTENEKPVAIIATKCDKLTRTGKKVSAEKIAREFDIDANSIYFSSSKTTDGRKKIHRLIEEYS